MGVKKEATAAPCVSKMSKEWKRPVLFISKALTETEKRYWPTELETGAVVWALHKLPQYADHGYLTIVTDHNVIAQSFKDTDSLKGKRSERLTNWKIYLAKFLTKAKIKHRAETSHQNVDALSRLPTMEVIPVKAQAVTNPEEPKSDVLYGHIQRCLESAIRKGGMTNQGAPWSVPKLQGSMLQDQWDKRGMPSHQPGRRANDGHRGHRASIPEENCNGICARQATTNYLQQIG